MPDYDDDIRISLDWLAYAVLFDPRLSIMGRHIGFDFLNRASSELGLPLSNERTVQLTEMQRDLPNLGGGHRDATGSVLALCNPLLQYADYIVPGRPKRWAASVRGDLRGKRGLSAEAGRYMRPRPEPMHPELGYFYSEMYSHEHQHPAAVNAREHAASEWYMFHAQAWGRRVYAEYMEERGLSECPHTHLTPAALRHRNPDDGSGDVYLFLAWEYMLACNTSVTLPVPALGRNAHELEGSSFYSPRAPSRLVVAHALEALFKARSMPTPPISGRARRELGLVPLSQRKVAKQLRGPDYPTTPLRPEIPPLPPGQLARDAADPMLPLDLADFPDV